jgi:hypothetical protein
LWNLDPSCSESSFPFSNPISVQRIWISNTLLKILRPEILPYHGTAPLLLFGGRETANPDPRIGGTSAIRFHSSFVAPVLRPQGQPSPLALISTSMEQIARSTSAPPISFRKQASMFPSGYLDPQQEACSRDCPVLPLPFSPQHEATNEENKVAQPMQPLVIHHSGVP